MPHDQPNKAKQGLFCVAHRGGRSLGTENSLATIQKGLDLGTDAVEIDVWNVQGELLVTHDRYLGRVIRGTGKLSALTSNDIATLQTVDNQPVATLEQVLQLVADRAILNIEIKGPACAPILAETLQKFCQSTANTIEQYVVSSFDHHQLFWLKQNHPEILRGVLISHIPIDYAQYCETLGAYSFHPNVDFVNASLVEDAHRRGAKVWVYTVNELEDFAEMATLGVDGVFTDFPDRLIQFNGVK